MVVSYKAVRNKKREKRTLSTQKNERPLVGLFQQKSSFVAFVKNEEVDEDDNQNLNGSKLIVTWSESIRSDGLTIFENEEVIKFSPLAFYSKISQKLTKKLATAIKAYNARTMSLRQIPLTFRQNFKILKIQF